MNSDQIKAFFGKLQRQQLTSSAGEATTSPDKPASEDPQKKIKLEEGAHNVKVEHNEPRSKHEEISKRIQELHKSNFSPQNPLTMPRQNVMSSPTSSSPQQNNILASFANVPSLKNVYQDRAATASLSDMGRLVQNDQYIYMNRNAFSMGGNSGSQNPFSSPQVQQNQGKQPPGQPSNGQWYADNETIEVLQNYIKVQGMIINKQNELLKKDKTSYEPFIFEQMIEKEKKKLKDKLEERRMARDSKDEKKPEPIQTPFSAGLVKEQPKPKPTEQQKPQHVIKGNAFALKNLRESKYAQKKNSSHLHKLVNRGLIPEKDGHNVVVPENMAQRDYTDYVMDLHLSEEQLKDPSLQKTRVGQQFQATIPTSTIKGEGAHKKELNQVWDPDWAQKEKIQEFERTINRYMGKQINNDERILALYRRFDFNVERTLDNIRKNRRYYSKLLGLIPPDDGRSKKGRKKKDQEEAKTNDVEAKLAQLQNQGNLAASSQQFSQFSMPSNNPFSSSSQGFLQQQQQQQQQQRLSVWGQSDSQNQGQQAAFSQQNQQGQQQQGHPNLIQQFKDKLMKQFDPSQLMKLYQNKPPPF